MRKDLRSGPPRMWITEDQTVELKNPVRNDLQSFLSKFPEGIAEWEDIHASMQDTGLALPTPKELIGTIAKYFGL